jgi:hypothetical protein
MVYLPQAEDDVARAAAAIRAVGTLVGAATVDVREGETTKVKVVLRLRR